MPNEETVYFLTEFCHQSSKCLGFKFSVQNFGIENKTAFVLYSNGQCIITYLYFFKKWNKIRDKIQKQKH